MPDMASFTSLTQIAFKDVLQCRKLWWFSIPVGLFLASGSYFATKAEEIVSGKDSTNVVTWLLTGTDETFLFHILLSFGLLLLQAPFRGMSVLLLQSVHLNRSQEKTHSLKREDFLRVGKTALVFESGLWVVVIVIGLILFFPSLLAWNFNREAFNFILQLAFLLFIGLALYLYFLKELSLMYGLLGRLTYRSALDLGLRLFRRHSFLTLLFFSYTVMLMILFSVVFQIFSHLLTLPFSVEYRELLTSFFSIPFLGLYFLFDQSIRLAYFRNIASPPKTPVVKVLLEKKVEPITGMNNV